MFIESVTLRVAPIRTRIPFRYGIAEMTVAPHVVVELWLREGRERVRGLASEHLPPKWFTKDPTTAFADDVADMVGAIESAASIAEGLEGDTAFELWWQLAERQTAWAQSFAVPGLVSGLGTSLVERALVDAACRLHGVPFSEAVRGALGIDVARIHPELAGLSLAELIPATPEPTIAIRHTVGLSDPLLPADVVDDPADGLPVALSEVLDTYGARYLKIKTAGNAEADVPRLRRIREVCRARGIDPWITIDGNESMRDADALAQWLRGLDADPVVSELLTRRLLVIEQPIARASALAPAGAEALRAVTATSRVIIDESDDAESTVREAMDLGYSGGTYKGCKGVIRGLANAALVAARSANRTILTAEDLSTVAPLTLPQDLVVAAVMGLPHIERNGHHYWGRPAAIDPDVDDKLARAHPHAFARVGSDPARLIIRDGVTDISGFLEAPFGLAADLDVSRLEPLSVASAVAAIGD